MLIEFATYHQYANEMFLRGKDGTILFLTKDQQDLQQKAKQFKRGQTFYVEGKYIRHRVLCSIIFAVDILVEPILLESYEN